MKTGKSLRTGSLVCLSFAACILLLSAFRSHEETVKAAFFKTHNSMTTFFGQDFDFDISCSIQSFELLYQPKKQDPLSIKNKGGDFSKEVSNAVQLAKPGDSYVFHEILARCPGDKAARKLPSLVFMIR